MTKDLEMEGVSWVTQAGSILLRERGRRRGRVKGKMKAKTEA